MAEKTAASPSGLVSFRNTPIKLTARVLIALLIACLFLSARNFLIADLIIGTDVILP